MVETIMRKYHIKNSNKLKQALFITIKAPITGRNVSQYRKKLSALINNENDAYIFILQKSKHVSAYTIKLLLAFNNSVSKLPGILFSEETKELIYYLGLDANFIIGRDARTIIKKIEQKHRKG